MVKNISAFLFCLLIISYTAVAGDEQKIVTGWLVLEPVPVSYPVIDDSKDPRQNLLKFSNGMPI